MFYYISMHEPSWLRPYVFFTARITTNNSSSIIDRAKLKWYFVCNPQLEHQTKHLIFRILWPSTALYRVCQWFYPAITHHLPQPFEPDYEWLWLYGSCLIPSAQLLSVSWWERYTYCGVVILSVLFQINNWIFIVIIPQTEMSLHLFILTPW